MRTPLLLLLCLAVLPKDGRGQQLITARPERVAADRELDPSRSPVFDAESLSRAASTIADDGEHAARVRARDSWSNGILIGAIAGAALLGTVGGIICHLEQEQGGPSCVPDLIRIAAIGGGIGAGAGLAVDAALTAHPGVTIGVRVRF